MNGSTLSHSPVKNAVTSCNGAASSCSTAMMNGGSVNDAIVKPTTTEINHKDKYMECPFYSYEALDAIAKYLRTKTNIRPKVGIIFGSGLNDLASSLKDADVIPYDTIPNFPVSTVAGHAGELVFGRIGEISVMCMKGRFHYYEGYPISKCSMPIRVMKLMGCTHLIATNAAGGLHDDFKVGDIMFINDHINLMGITGTSPLQGPNDPRFGQRFFPMAKAYDKNMLKLAREVARDIGIMKHIKQGVYTCLGGPNYETVAELRMLKTIGVDAVGMSTVHEVVTAVHCEMKVFAFSLITNLCSTSYDDSDEEANHDEVVMVGRQMEGTCRDFVSEFVRRLQLD
uniref:Purine nucleoside phosphorylase n=1 Tax=Tabanus bromius TaxID=304241 RepID=A0A0K8TQJ9_TABBR